MPAIYLFGSRVRGDHRPDSDVDLSLLFDEWSDSDPTAQDEWWGRQNRSDFAELKAALPGPPRLHVDQGDPALGWVRSARVDPGRIVLQVRRAVCFWTPPKPIRRDRAQV